MIGWCDEDDRVILQARPRQVQRLKSQKYFLRCLANEVIPFWCWIPLIGLSPEHKETNVCYLFEINPLSVESLLKLFREEPFWLIQVQLYDKWKFVLNRLAMYFGSKNNIFCASKKSKNDIFSEQIGSVFWVQKWNMLRGEQGLKRESLVKLLICFVKNNAWAVLPEK